MIGYDFNPEIKAFNLTTQAKKRAYKIQMTKIRNKHEITLRRNVRKVFKAQDKALQAAESLEDWNKIVEIIHASDQLMKASLGFTYQKIAADIYPMLDTTKRVKRAYELKATDNMIYDNQLRQWIEDNLGEKITNIDHTTLKQIRVLYDQAVLQGAFRDSLLEITFRDKLHQLYAGSITPFRANCIARTETAQASNRAALETTKAVGFDATKEWIAVGDMDTRDSHAMMDGKIVDLNGLFDVDGLNGPCQMDCPLDSTHGAPVEEVANCRCFVGFNYD